MSPPQNQQTDQTANFFWLLALISIGLLLFWWLEEKRILEFVFTLRHYEIDLILASIYFWNTIGHFSMTYLPSWLHLPLGHTAHWRYLQHYMNTATPKQVPFSAVESISEQTGDWIRYPTMFILSTLAFISLFKHRSQRFHHRHDMQSLKKIGVEVWPSITPVSTLNLLKQDLDEGPWAMAEQPLQFCKKHNLLQLTVIKSKTVYTINRGNAEQLFVLQVGSLWPGVAKLPIHIKALVVIFVAKAMREHDTSHHLLDQIAASAHHGKLNFTGVEELAAKLEKNKLIRWLERRHAYVATLLASLLEIARTDGVLASAEFLWLKPVDRKLWYMLSNVGRQTAFIEVAGLFAHWQAEKKLKKPLRTPTVKEAVNALEDYMNNTLHIADDEKWHTSNVD